MPACVGEGHELSQVRAVPRVREVAIGSEKRLEQPALRVFEPVADRHPLALEPGAARVHALERVGRCVDRAPATPSSFNGQRPTIPGIRVPCLGNGLRQGSPT